MRDDWLRLETIRPFIPDRLSWLTNPKVLGVLLIALIILAVVIRTVG